jgi:hypothetical protein
MWMASRSDKTIITWKLAARARWQPDPGEAVHYSWLRAAAVCSLLPPFNFDIEINRCDLGSGLAESRKTPHH